MSVDLEDLEELVVAAENRLRQSCGEMIDSYHSTGMDDDQIALHMTTVLEDGERLRYMLALLQSGVR